MEKVTLKEKLIEEIMSLRESIDTTEFFSNNRRFAGKNGNRIRSLSKYGLKLSSPNYFRGEPDVESFVSYDDLSTTELMYILNYLGGEV